MEKLTPEEEQQKADEFRKVLEDLGSKPKNGSKIGCIKFLLILLFCLAVFVGVVWWYCSHEDQQQGEEQHAIVIRQQQKDASIAALALKNNAVTNWAASLPDRGMGGVFTIDLTKALVRTNGQPVAMEASLEDVSERGGAFTVHFSVFDFTSPHPHTFNLRLELNCNAQQAEYLLKSKPAIAGYADFVVVATIESISRPAFGADDLRGTDTYHIDFSSTPEVFYAKGTCVDLVLLEKEITD